jgi:putative ABC transport system permease protein
MTLRVLWSRLTALFTGRQPEAELTDEIRTHLDLLTEEHIRRGMSPDEARAAAHRDFGGVAQVRETYSDARGMPWVSGLLHDIRFAARQLRRNPGFTFAAVLTLALGIGANAAIFSVVRGVLLQPLPNRDENRLMYLRQTARGIGVENALFSVPEIRDLRTRLKTITNLGEFSTIQPTVVGLGDPRQVKAGVVDGNFFPTMGLRPVLGRLIGPDDDGPKAAGVVVLTHRFWSGVLQSDPSVIGKTIRMGAGTATIIGVLEPSVPYPEQTELIANMVTSPHHLSATMVTGREHRMTEVFGRLAAGADLDAAKAELVAAYGGMTQEYPEVYTSQSDFHVDVVRLRDQITSRARTILIVLLAASGLIFLIACANVANLVLARTVRREPELAVRSALGASASTIRRTLLAESLVLCGAGAVAGILIARPMFATVSRFASRYSVRALDLQLDSTPLWVGAGLALSAAVLLAFVPRLPSAGHANQRATGTNRRLRGFAVAQIAASFMLLAGAGMLIRTLYTLQQTNPGFDTSVLAVNLPVVNVGRTPADTRAFYRDVQRRISQMPGVDQVMTGSFVPWRDVGQSLSRLNPRPGGMQFTIEGVAYNEHLRARGRAVSAGFFGALDIPLLQGREFNDADLDGAERVVIISNSIAQTMFPGQSAINRHLMWTDPVGRFVNLSPEPRRIVGVVADVDDEKIEPGTPLTVYHPFEQELQGGRLFVVYTGSDPYSLVPPIERMIRDMAPQQPVEQASTLEDVRSEVMSPERVNTIVFGVFAAVALVISVVGIGGVLAFSVSGRMREFGVRLAIGSAPGRLLLRVLTEGVAMAAFGIAAGLAVGGAVTRVASAYIPGLQLPGALPLAGAIVLLFVATAIAALIPAARAARVDPVIALRCE